MRKVLWLFVVILLLVLLILAASTHVEGAYGESNIVPFWDENSNGALDSGEKTFDAWVLVFYTNPEDPVGTKVTAWWSAKPFDFSAPGLYGVRLLHPGAAKCKLVSVVSPRPRWWEPVYVPCRKVKVPRKIFLPMVFSRWEEIPAWDTDLHPGDIPVPEKG